MNKNKNQFNGKEYLLKFTDSDVKIKINYDSDISLSDIKDSLQEKNIVEVDSELLEERFQDRYEDWFTIAPRIKDLDEDDKISLKISDDRMKAFMSFDPGNGSSIIHYEDVKILLEEKDICFGLKEDQIKKIIENRIPVNETLIAEGKKPEAGKDSELIYHFEQKEKNVGTLRQDGTMDFHNRNLITNVKKGEKLLTKIPAQKGKPGRNVKGDEVKPQPVKDKKLPRGKNTVKKDLCVYAAIDGQVIKEKDKVHVRPVLNIKGDVDLTTGNIDFLGSVKISGDVREGFIVKAAGDIDIQGNVGAAEIKSSQNVSIKKGFLGRGKGKIEAEGEVRVRFVENGSITAEKIMIHDASMHSELKAKDRIVVKGGKGLIVGGKASAHSLIEANIVGSSLATKTILEVGLDPGIHAKYKEKKDEMESLKKNLDKVMKGIRMLKQLKNKGIKLTKDKIVMFNKFLETEKELKKKEKNLKEEIEDLELQLSNNVKGEIKINELVFPGVHLLSSKDKLIIQNKTAESCFTEVNGELRQKTL
ncbi:MULTISPECIES: DUF342 domain-containing protein [unclassified Halanaerobium]|uniref:DUF342 domain-containing protein n=1 Tax=unclassified Halanaerobium TaxID=2641197 RepID=UPI000DF35283|nr:MULTISPECIES: FapA family protein [unclassified Halanaerobium]RCW47668.1 hypothetical protein DFR78_11210 [Halanaerobium sp. MA284_MarDTE_T2]RCW84688.1 hypothetical protein DER71_11357 [Halanaerobium sp. DL-01]